MMSIGKKLESDALTSVSGGTGSTGITIKAVGVVIRVSGPQTSCQKCGGALVPQCYSTDNGRTAYNGQECTNCGTAYVYGENIM